MMQCVQKALVPLLLCSLAGFACGDDSGDGLGGRDAGAEDADAGLSGDVDSGSGDLPDARPDVGAPDAEPDAGIEDLGPEDTGTVDAGAFACAFPETLEGVLDGQVEITVNTAEGDLRPRDLGLLCGNTDPATQWAPQRIVAYEVPGTGGIAVSFSARRVGTPTNFDTVIQVRRDCDSPPRFEDGRFPALTCFDDSGVNPNAPDVRSEGTIQAQGGELLYFVVTGFSGGGPVPNSIDEGPVQLRISATANEPPQLTEATAFVNGNDVIIRLDGDDADGNVRGAIMNFRIDGQLLDIYGSGNPDRDASTLIFDVASGELDNYLKRPPTPLLFDAFPPSSVQGNFELLASQITLNPPLGGFISSNGISQLGLRLYDTAFAVTDEVLADVVVGAGFVGYGEACDAALCEEPLACDMGICGASAIGQTTCSATNVIESGLAPNPGEYAATTIGAQIPSGPGGFVAPSCVSDDSAAGAEVVVSVTVPAGGAFDLVADTDNATTGTTDTLVHVRSDCIDPRTEVVGSCNDDIDGSTSASAIELRDLAPGTYAVVVERWTTSPPVVPTDVGLDLALRPVVGQGETCDPAGVESRCAPGTGCQTVDMTSTCQPE